MIQNTKYKRGFTLIELLVVVAVFMILAVLVTNSLFSILKSNTKANLMKEIRQNGNYVLDLMDKTISGSQEIINCGSTYLQITDADGEVATFQCLSQPDNNRWVLNDVRLTSSKITLKDCNNVFVCEETRLGEGFDKVTINFILKQRGTSTRPEEIAQETFTKTIFLRNKK